MVGEGLLSRLFRAALAAAAPLRIGMVAAHGMDASGVGAELTRMDATSGETARAAETQGPDRPTICAE